MLSYSFKAYIILLINCFSFIILYHSFFINF
ncbi:hypothetical protein CoNPh11_CDS0004 [Staphylococcus phage S-CoN_Ph11]|nr:hypothetical protein CoNPh11_CDS0004 [Staphylococcus phage S-CoN_Ph11]